MILPLRLARILMLAALTAIPSNLAFARHHHGNSLKSASPPSLQESVQQQSNNTGNAAVAPQVSNTTGNVADLENSILAVHNSEREAVGVPRLVWSDELATDANTWAEYLVED